MASLQSFASGSVAVSVDLGAGVISITGGVLTIDGALDALDDRIHTIDCSSSGGLRSTSGASGTLRATGGRTLNVIERANAHRFGGDNGKQSNSNGSNSRFAGDATNALIYEAINWAIEAGGRSDFDFGAGSNADGSLGTGVTMRGVYVNIEAETAGANNNFPHLWSQNAKLEIHPELGYGLRMANYTQSHGFLIEVQPNAQFAGLVVDDIAAVASGGGRVVVSPPNNTTYTLFNLDTPDITESNNAQATGNKTILVDPVGLPPRSNNWGGYYSTMEVQRTIDFAFTGAADATGTLVALHQSAEAEAADATGTIASSGAGSVRVKTNISASSGSTGAWTSLDGFQFYAHGYGFRKYWSGSTAVNVGNAPATRQVALTADALPDGTAVAAYAGNDGATTASGIYRIIKTHEAANPTHRTLGAPLATIDASGNIDVDSTVSLRLSTSQATAAAWDGGTSTLTVKVVAGITGDAGINSINFGDRALPALQAAFFAMPITTSAGTSSLVQITGMAEHFTGVYTAAGAALGSHTFTANGFAPAILASAADSAAGTKVVYAKPGETCTSRTLDLSGGGTFTVDFGDLPVERDQHGEPLYDATATLAGLTAAFDANGRCTLEIPNATATIKQLYKAFADGIATEAGGAFCALGRQLLSISQYEGQAANLTLGPDIQLRRAASSGNDAAVAAVVSGGINGVKVNADRGEVAFLPSAGGTVDLAPVTAALAALRRMLRHVMASLPITWHAPFSPKCIATGMAGQEILRDTEESQWSLAASGSAAEGDPNAEGLVTFNGANSHIDYSLNRAGPGEPVDLYTTEVITMAQVRPDAFAADAAQSLCSIGALLISIAPSAGTSAALRVGPINGVADTVAELTLGEFNDVVIAFSNNPARPNNPRVRISINGAAEETVNVGPGSTISDGIFGPIGSNTENYRFGGHGTGGQTGGFTGQARAIFVHPANELHGDAGWAIPAGLRWNEDYQLWLGAQIMDRIEGLAKDLIEAQLVEILGKSFTADELGLFPWRAKTSQLTSAAGSIGKLLAERRNPETAAVIRDAILQYEAETGVELLDLWRAVGAALAGRAAPLGAVTEFRAAGGEATAPKRLRMTTGDVEGERVNVEINPAD